jgi:rubrerythrin
MLRDTLNEKMTARFLTGLLATPAGRAHLLNQVADAESTGEGAIFAHLLAHVVDPKLRHMIERHQADEIRHSALFRECLERTGFQPTPVPSSLRLLYRLDALAGGVMEQPVKDDRDVMLAYMMLLVIEERAVSQFTQFIPAFDVVDPETANVFRSVARDEERHLRYCHAISRRYSTSDAMWEADLLRFRTLEARAYSDNSRANMDYVFEHGLHTANFVERAVWRSVHALAAGTGQGPRTRFWGTHEVAKGIEASA